MGPVCLTVADAARSLAFYRDAVGLAPLGERDGRVLLGVGGRELLSLIEEPGAQPSPTHTGLFHFALLVLERIDLARWLVHASQERVRLTGASDHYVSEAVYLSDPDGHGIEIYWDRPREIWEGKVAGRMTTAPLDTGDLLAEVADPTAEAFAGLPDGTSIGHVHLKVASLSETVAFYRDVLGFELMAHFGAGAAFFGAGGYHHHIGANTWQSAGAPPPPPGSAALVHATIAIPGREDLDRLLTALDDAGHDLEDAPDGPAVRDPSGNALALSAPER